ncbi:uncharacterized protein LOC132702408 [Cylas formicarius]|uniref:uncharacterized protein LOC132702408 n=1 Tax=Cylas formicarius TaxID=197179 RepID=UPI002958495C|nr:uncharacterized protein LOC132702408 [Cylas formicarius]
MTCVEVDADIEAECVLLKRRLEETKTQLLSLCRELPRTRNEPELERLNQVRRDMVETFYDKLIGLEKKRNDYGETEIEAALINRQYCIDLKTRLQQQIDKEWEEISSMYVSQAPAGGTLESRERVDWLSNVRHRLGVLDNATQKLVFSFKRAAVMVFSGLFRELKSLEDPLTDIHKLEETELHYDLDTYLLRASDDTFGSHRKVWEAALADMEGIIEDGCRFLAAALELWQHDFERVQVMQSLVLRDIDETMRWNDALAQSHEPELNILIDTLREESSREELDGIMERIFAFLRQIEDRYAAQHRAECDVAKKYDALAEVEGNVVRHEIVRFLLVYESYTVRKEDDHDDAVLPNQMLYCKFQVGALKNWQFGLWLAIKKYLETSREEIRSAAAEWVADQTARIDARWELRLEVHRRVPECVEFYVYRERLEELCRHNAKLTAYEKAVQNNVERLKRDRPEYDSICARYSQELRRLEVKTTVNANFAILQTLTAKTLEDVHGGCAEYAKRCDVVLSETNQTSFEFLRAARLFHEGGNFDAREARDLAGRLNALNAYAKKGAESAKNDDQNRAAVARDVVAARTEETFRMIRIIEEERRFDYEAKRIVRRLESDAKRQANELSDRLKRAKKSFDELRQNINDEDFDKVSSTYSTISDDIIHVGERLLKTVPSEGEQWRHLQAIGEKFYAEESRRIYSSVPPTLEDFIEKMREKLANVEKRRETDRVAILREFLKTAAAFHSFFRDYFDSYAGRRSRKFTREFGAEFETILAEIEIEKGEIGRRYRNFIRELMPLHGHPNNAPLLADLKWRMMEMQRQMDEALSNQDRPRERLQRRFERYEGYYREIAARMPEIIENNDRVRRLIAKLRTHSAGQTPAEMVPAPPTADVNLGLPDLRQCFDSYKERLEEDDLDAYHAKLKLEWQDAVERVLDLYKCSK